MKDQLLPPKGEQTSSFKVAVIAAVAPVPLAVALIVAILKTNDAPTRSALLTALNVLVIPAILGGAAVAYQYIGKRGDVAKAKVDAYATINAPASNTGSASVKIEAESGQSPTV